jgi:hypothetical protein
MNFITYCCGFSNQPRGVIEYDYSNSNYAYQVLNNGIITKINMTNYTTTEIISGMGTIHGHLCRVNEYLYIANTSGTLYQVNTISETKTTITTGFATECGVVSIDPDFLYGLNTSGYCVRIHISTGTKMNVTSSLSTCYTALLPSNIDSNILYAINSIGKLYKINISGLSKSQVADIGDVYNCELRYNDLNTEEIIIPSYDGSIYIFNTTTEITSTLCSIAGSPALDGGYISDHTNMNYILVPSKEVKIYRINRYTGSYSIEHFNNFGTDITCGAVIDINNNRYYFLSCIYTYKLMRVAFNEASTCINASSEIAFYPPIPDWNVDKTKIWHQYTDVLGNMFWDYGKTKYYYINHSSASGAVNFTILHNCPLEEEISNYKIGKPVFNSGNTYKLSFNKLNNYYEYVKSSIIDYEDCIPSVKSTGNSNEFLGIITAIYNSMDALKNEINTLKSDIKIVDETISFATHGDYIFKCADTSIYKIGDSIDYNGIIIDTNTPLTISIVNSCIGIITSILNNETLTIFKK